MSGPRVLVTRRLPGPALERLAASGAHLDLWPEFLPPPPAVLLERAHGVNGLITTVEDRVDAALMDAAGPGLTVIAQYAVGTDNVDLAAARARGVRVTNTPGVLTEATADLAFALLAAVTRRVVAGNDLVRRGEWRTWHPALLLGPELHGATLGIVGWGRIGAAVARRAAGFSMRLRHAARSEHPDAAALGSSRRPLEALLAESDFVSLHAPLTAETHRLLDARRLALMKPGAILVNTARGGLVDTGALVEALAAGRLGGAGLDVTDPEPLPADHPLLTLEHVVVTPHLGSAGRSTRERMADLAVDNLLAALAGLEPPNAVA